jgi:hypothetical protein
MIRWENNVKEKRKDCVTWTCCNIWWVDTQTQVIFLLVFLCGS